MTNHDQLEILAGRAISVYHMLEGAKLILVALSGGADSVALLHYLRFGRGLHVVACHVNHNLRGKESERDEDFVRQLCRQWEIPLFVESADVLGHAKEKNLGLEEAGREIRYRFFETIRQGCGAERIATAHTASDNLETILLNLARGTARRGLCGIPPVRSNPVIDGGKDRENFPLGQMIRPLIFCSREDVEDYCLHHGLSYVIDSSNMRDDYSRNKVRHRIVPVLRSLNPDVINAAAHTTAVFREEELLLDQMAQELLARCREEGEQALACEPLLEGPRALRRRAAAIFLGENGVRLSGELLENVLEMAEAGGGKRMLAPGRYLLVRNGRLYLEVPPAPASYFEVSLGNGWPAEAALPGGRILRAGICEKSGGQTEQKVYKNLLYLALDYDKIKGKILVRQRRSGDSISLAGRNGTKSLKKLLIERKLTAYEKSVLPILSDEEGVVAVWGIGVDRRCVPGPDTKRILLVQECPEKTENREERKAFRPPGGKPSDNDETGHFTSAADGT